MTAELVKKWHISGLISGNLAISTVLVLEKVLFWCFWVPQGINLRLCSKTQWQMFLLVSGRHVGAHPDGHQHGVSIQISINLGKASPHILHKKNCSDLNLGESPCTVTFLSQVLDLSYWTVFIFFWSIWMAWHWKPAMEEKLQKCFGKESNLAKNTHTFENFLTRISFPLDIPSKISGILGSMVRISENWQFSDLQEIVQKDFCIPVPPFWTFKNFRWMESLHVYTNVSVSLKDIVFTQTQ